MAGIIALAIALVVGFVIVSSIGQNRLELESSTKLAETALAVKKREVARNLRDYAGWEDVYRNLHEKIDLEWAATDGNVGANVLDTLGYEFAFVIAPGGETVYAVIDGEPREVEAGHFLPHGLDVLLDRARREEAPAVGVLRGASDIALVAATVILSPSNGGNALSPEQRSIIIFAKKLDERFLARISEEYLLRRLALIGSDDKEEATIPLLDPAGESIGQLAWHPEKPGTELLRLLLPPLSLSGIVLMAFAGLVVTNARRSALVLEESARTVEAYAQTVQESEARFRDVAEASSDWIWECDPDLRLSYLSGRFSEVTGTAAATILGKTLRDFFSEEPDVEAWDQLVAWTSERAAFRDLRCCYRDASGRTRICRLAGRPILDQHEAFIGYRGTATDITEEVEAQSRAHHLALHDALTELPNRVLFHERLDAAITGRRHVDGKLAVLCLDLDHFKEVNDTLGHGAGDLLLKEVAERLKTCVRPIDTVARLGGDEFAVIQLHIRDIADVQQLGSRIIEMLKEPFCIEGHEIYVSVSIGVALSEATGGDPERLLKSADIALYRAKQAGRCTMRFFEPAMDQELQARKALEYDLRQALMRNEFELHYQPLIDLETQSIVAVEALLRWSHPERGSVPPSEFIRVAEETGLILGIGEWVLRMACSEALNWRDVRVAVNLSPVQFRNRELVDMVRDALAKTGLDPSRLELEITESVLINDTNAALAILTELKQLGVKIAMDDFGTGYSSLGYLNSFPFDKIKIDRSFVSHLNEADKSSAIVRSVLGLGQNLQIVTTAEGVETMEQAHFLTQEGCTQAQGYLFGRPVPARQFTTFIKNWTGLATKPSSDEAA